MGERLSPSVRWNESIIWRGVGAPRMRTNSARTKLPGEDRAQRRLKKHKELAPPITAKIAAALRHGQFLSASEADEAAFHLTDWMTELADLNALFAKTKWNPKLARSVLMAFVVHVPEHLAAAHRIIMQQPVTDTFLPGAVWGDGKPQRESGKTPSPTLLAGSNRAVRSRNALLKGKKA